MAFVETVFIQCPYCWQQLEILIDPSVKRQEYTEDCEVCCRPIVLNIEIDEFATPHVQARREDD